MTGMIRKALLIAAGIAVVASVASAGVPDPAFSTIGQVAVGTNRGVLTDEPSDVNGPGFNVTVRDVTNAPLNGVLVTLNYGTSGMKLYTPQDAGTTLGVSGCTISRTTDIAGKVVFGPRTTKFTNVPNVEVSANGVVLGNVRARSTDIDGSTAPPNGLSTSLTDLGIFSVAYLLNPSTIQTDYNNTLDAGGQTGLGDLSIFSAEYLLAPTNGATHSFCP